MNDKIGYSGVAVLHTGAKPMTRTVIAIEQALPVHMIDEAERMAYFDQSARTAGGKVAEYVKPEPVQVASWAA